MPMKYRPTHFIKNKMDMPTVPTPSSTNEDEVFAKGATFPNFSIFQNAIKELECRQNAVFVLRSSNKVISPDMAHLVYESAAYECKHGAVRKTRSKGIRPNQRSLKLGCQAKIRIKAVRLSGNWQLVVTKVMLQHDGHVPTLESVSVLPERRKPKLTAQLTELLKCSSCSNAEVKRIVYQEQGILLFSKDVFNLKAKVRQEEGLCLSHEEGGQKINASVIQEEDTPEVSFINRLKYNHVEGMEDTVVVKQNPTEGLSNLINQECQEKEAVISNLTKEVRYLTNQGRENMEAVDSKFTEELRYLINQGRQNMERIESKLTEELRYLINQGRKNMEVVESKLTEELRYLINQGRRNMGVVESKFTEELRYLINQGRQNMDRIESKLTEELRYLINQGRQNMDRIESNLTEELNKYIKVDKEEMDIVESNVTQVQSNLMKQRRQNMNTADSCTDNLSIFIEVERKELSSKHVIEQERQGINKQLSEEISHVMKEETQEVNKQLSKELSHVMKEEKQEINKQLSEELSHVIVEEAQNINKQLSEELSLMIKEETQEINKSLLSKELSNMIEQESQEMNELLLSEQQSYSSKKYDPSSHQLGNEHHKYFIKLGRNETSECRSRMNTTERLGEGQREEIWGENKEQVYFAENHVVNETEPMTPLSPKARMAASDVKTHKAIHSVKKTFHCQTCRKVFSRYSSLKAHQSVHNRKRPFKCLLCQKVFSRHCRHTGLFILVKKVSNAKSGLSCIPANHA